MFIIADWMKIMLFVSSQGKKAFDISNEIVWKQRSGKNDILGHGVST